MKRIRLFVFPQRPDFLLVYAPGGATFSLPLLTVPLTRTMVSQAMAKTGQSYTVSETTPGRWQHAMTMAVNAERGESRQRQLAVEATQAALLRSSNNPIVRERSEVILHKQEVDERIRALKDKIAKAKKDAFEKGKYMPRSAFVGLERELHDKQNESVALQSTLRTLREDEKRENLARSAANAAAKVAYRETHAHVFRRYAKKMLAADVFEEINQCVMAEVGEAPEPDDGVDANHEGAQR